MISDKLQGTFKVLEMLAFPEWQKANESKKLRMTKDLGELEGKMIIEEIEANLAKLTASTK